MVGTASDSLTNTPPTARTAVRPPAVSSIYPSLPRRAVALTTRKVRLIASDRVATTSNQSRCWSPRSANRSSVSAGLHSP
jgi:hypothetical protein